MRSTPSIAATKWISVARSVGLPSSARARVGVDVLAEQRDFAHPLAGQPGDFVQHLRERTADFLAARIGHDAEAAVLAAAFHDRDERAWRRGACGAGSRSNFSISGKLTSICARPVLAQLADHVGQAMQGLRTEHQVHERRPRGDALPFLAGDAAADADHARAAAAA